MRQMARRVSRVLAVLPFEAQLYQDAGVPVDFVGHPLARRAPARPRPRRGAPPARRRSRRVGDRPPPGQPPRGDGAPPAADARRRQRLSAAGLPRRFALGLAPSWTTAAVGLVNGRGRRAGGPRVDVLEQRTYEVMAAADVVLISSGTATLEAALLGTPMVVCYRVSRVTEADRPAPAHAHPAGAACRTYRGCREVVPELLQDEVTGHGWPQKSLRLLDEPWRRGRPARRLRRAARPARRARGAEATRPRAPSSPPRARHDGVAPTGAAARAPARGAPRSASSRSTCAVRFAEGRARARRSAGGHAVDLRDLALARAPAAAPLSAAARLRVLASRSRDGELVARSVAPLGLEVGARLFEPGRRRARFAPSRDGWPRASSVMVVPDGPRGPREVVKPGLVALAALSGAAIVPVALGRLAEWRLRSWDGFRIPRPFARCVVRFGAPDRGGARRRPPTCVRRLARRSRRRCTR